MTPILYDKTKTTFTTDYIGRLSDAVSCVVTEERNEGYELEMTYPVNGIFYESLELDGIIKAKPNNQDDPQPFRIYDISKETNGIITVNAHHIVYDLSRVTVEPFVSTGTISDAITGIVSHSIPSCGFIFETNKTTAGNYKVSYPSTFRSLMGGTQGSLLDVYGTAEYHYDEYNISLLTSRGADRGVHIKYGINIVDMKQEEACESLYTAVYPFWQYGSDYLQLDEKIVSVDGTFPFSRIMVLDLSPDFSNKPTQEQLRNKARQYITNNEVGIPKVSLDVNFTGTEAEQDINLCDIVTVDFEKYGISASAKCVSLTYDVLLERVTNVKLGYYKHDFIDMVVDQVKGKTSYAALKESDIEQAIRSITDNGNGYLLLHSSTNTAHIDELLILTDTDNVALAQKLWRWNKNGLAYSSTGYNGSFTTAITSGGEIVATMIKTGILRAIEITAGNGLFSVTPSGYMTASSGRIGESSTGFTISATDIKNSMIRLYQNGVALIESNSEKGLIGKTDSAQSSDYHQKYKWLEPDVHAVMPGIGIFMPTNFVGLGMFYLTQSGSILTANSIIRYPFEVSTSSGTVIESNAIRFYKNINMNGHGFFCCWPGSQRQYQGGIQYRLESQHLEKTTSTFMSRTLLQVVGNHSLIWYSKYKLRFSTDASGSELYVGILKQGT